MKKFIKVFNEEDKSKLLALGYHLVSESGNVSIFLNDLKLSFSKDDVKNISYSDILTF